LPVKRISSRVTFGCNVFFAEVVFDDDAIARLIVGLFDFQPHPYYLTLEK
jgi:hypothetical protein